MKEIRSAATKSAAAISKLENPLLDPALLRMTQEFLQSRIPQFTESDGRDIYQLINGLARKVVPLTETHILAAKSIYESFLGDSRKEGSADTQKNNIEFLRKIVFCLEEPMDTETSLSDEEFRILERLVNSFSDRLKFNPGGKDLAVREDLIVAAFRKEGVVSGSVQRVLAKVAKFTGLTTKKGKIYDISTGKERIAIYYQFLPEFEAFLDELFLLDHGRNQEGQETKLLSQDVPVELLYCFIQAWRAVNLEPDVLGEYLINGICSLLAYTILLALPEGATSHTGEVSQSQGLLADEVCHPIIVALSKAVAFAIYGDNWLGAIWDSPKKSKYHRSVRYVTVGSIIHLRQGVIVLNNNVMTLFVRNYVIRIGSEV